MLNIKTLAVKETSELHLRSADDALLYTEDGKPITITLHGLGSKVYVAAKAAQHRRMVGMFKKNKGKSELTADEQLSEAAEFFAAVTVSFNNFRYDESLSGSEEFKAAYSDRSIGFIADQVSAFLGSWANFTQASTKK